LKQKKEVRGVKVKIHWNLHKGGITVEDSPRHGSKLRYQDSICLKNATFKVSASAMRRIKLENQRMVGAWIIGDVCDCGKHQGAPIYFNPYKHESRFVRTTDSAPVASAQHVSIRTIGTGKTARPDTRACEIQIEVK
jgi:hypothetical protein